MNILTFAKKPHKVNLTRDFKPDIFVDEKSPKYRGYPYGMSLDICKRLILEHTQENDTVYDPFMGSGTTAIACLETNRKYLGTEIDNETYKLSQNRISEVEHLRRFI